MTFELTFDVCYFSIAKNDQNQTFLNFGDDVNRFWEVKSRRFVFLKTKTWAFLRIDMTDFCQSLFWRFKVMCSSKKKTAKRNIKITMRFKDLILLSQSIFFNFCKNLFQFFIVIFFSYCLKILLKFYYSISH